MIFKDILIHIDDSPQCITRLELAINLARKHGAFLTGIYVITHAHFAPQGEVIAQKAKDAGELFREKTGDADIESEWIIADWGVVGIDMSDVINYHAHLKDLIIIGQADKDRQKDEVPTDLPEQIVIGSGRPVLIVPYAGKFSSVGENVIVAWRGGRASARAVNDALPFLQDAQNIHVLSIKAYDAQLGEVGKARDLCAHLAHHGLECHGQDIISSNIPVANVLMNYAWDKGCDLLVVGVYVLKSGRKPKLGPVAQQLLKDMTLPVLMSH